MENALQQGSLPRPTKRTHSQMTGIGTSSVRSGRENNYEDRQPRYALQQRSPPPLSRQRSSPPQYRYAGDGFDFRRPMTPSHPPRDDSNPHNSNEESLSTSRSPFGQASRGPRFGRSIIDLSEENSSRSSSSRGENRTNTSEVQFVAERRLPSPPHPSGILGFTRDDPFRVEDDDEVQFVREQHRIPPPNPPTLPSSSRLHGVGSFSSNNPLLRVANSITNSARQLAGYRVADLPSGSNSSRNATTQRRFPTSSTVGTFVSTLTSTGNGNFTMSLTDFIAPSLDYGNVGFDMGFEDDTPSHEPERIISPPPAPRGFTRSPKSHEVYVCPNCDRELRTGDTEVQRQIWIIRACGHTYCGECAAQRQISKHKNAKTPLSTKPFTKCVEESCRQKIGARSSMIQIFL